MLLTFLLVCAAFASGGLVGRKLRAKPAKEKLVPASVPIAELVADFEEFARGFEGGALSTDADAALKVLRAHAEQKYLPAPKKGIKKRSTFDGNDNDRKKEWCDMRCFEKEMAKAVDDDERITVIRRCMNKYIFTQTWQTWCIQEMSSIEGRNKLREIFDSQE